MSFLKTFFSGLIMKMFKSQIGVAILGLAAGLIAALMGMQSAELQTKFCAAFKAPAAEAPLEAIPAPPETK